MLIEGTYYLSREAERLLTGRDVRDLREEEYVELLLSYSHVGATEAFALVSRLAADRFPDSLELARARANSLTAFLPLLDSARTEFLARGDMETKHAKFYLIAFADHLVTVAWGANELCLGDQPEEPMCLDEAAKLLARPGVRGYYDEYLLSDGVLGGARQPIPFLEWFEPLYRFPRFPR